MEISKELPKVNEETLKTDFQSKTINTDENLVLCRKGKLLFCSKGVEKTLKNYSGDLGNYVILDGKDGIWADIEKTGRSDVDWFITPNPHFLLYFYDSDLKNWKIWFYDYKNNDLVWLHDFYPNIKESYNVQKMYLSNQFFEELTENRDCY